MNNNFTAIFIKNFFNLSINQGINILIAIIATPILFQNLEESQFGLVNLAFSIFMLISIVVSYGYHLNGPKRISLLNKIFSSFSKSFVSLQSISETIFHSSGNNKFSELIIEFFVFT